MKKISILLEVLFLFTFFFLGGLQTVLADTTVTCYKDCSPTYSNYVGVVILNPQCNATSPVTFNAQLTVNGVKTPIHKKDCPPPSSLNISVNGCKIGLDQSKCVGSVDWDFYNALSPYEVKNVTSNFPSVVLGSTNKGVRVPVTLHYGINKIVAKNNQLNDFVTVDVVCEDGLTWSPDTSNCTDSHIPEITISANPWLIRRNQTSVLTWKISDLTANECTINGPGLTNYRIVDPESSVITGPITSYSNFTIACSSSLHPNITKSTQVEVIPSMREI